MQSEKPPNRRGLYGGWWFFAFPIAHVRHDPFPFFVRGDDVSFALANRFRIATLNGVMAWQEDFAARQTPLTQYLDLRSHLHHQMVFAYLRCHLLSQIATALRLVLRSLLRMDYDGAAVQIFAWRDLMKGPALFLDDPEMRETRLRIQALGSGIHHHGTAPDWPERRKPPPWIFGFALKCTLNGHLLPFWNAIGRSAICHARHQNSLWPFWGVARVFIHHVPDSAGIMRRHDKRRFWRLLAESLWLALVWSICGPARARAFRETYADMTSPAFWARQFAEPITDLPPVQPVKLAS